MSKYSAKSLKVHLYMSSWFLAALIIPSAAPGVINIRMQTDLGGVDIELFNDDTPETFMNFMNYINARTYDGTFIHRSSRVAESGVDVTQMGGYKYTPADGAFGGAGTPHIDEFLPGPVNEPGILNTRGTLAMAKGADPNSATSEFFVNMIDHPFLDDVTQTHEGFTVFGQVTGGMDIIDAIFALDRCQDLVFNNTVCKIG